MEPRYFLQKINKNNLHCVQRVKMIEKNMYIISAYVLNFPIGKKVSLCKKLLNLEKMCLLIKGLLS